MTRKMMIFHPAFTQDNAGPYTGAGGLQYRYTRPGEAGYAEQWKDAFVSQDERYALAYFYVEQLSGDSWGICTPTGETMHGLPVYHTSGILPWNIKCRRFEELTGESVCSEFADCSKPTIAIAASKAAMAHVASVQPLHEDVSGTDFASFTEPITAKKYQETDTMCATPEQAIETNCDCAWHDRQVEQTVDPAVQFMARTTGVLAIAALLGALVVLTGGFIAVLAGVTGVLYLVYKLRRVALTVVLAALSIVAFPLRFFGGMVADGIAELKQEKAQAAPQPAMLSNNYRVVEPLLLSDNLQPDSIEFDSVEPVFVNIPSRKATKATMKMEAK